MITYQNNRRGRPKGSKAPASTSSRVKKFRQNLRESGGETITLCLDEGELQQLDNYKERLLLPAKTSRSEVLKSMTCVLGGGVYFTSGHQITASIEIVERRQYPEWMQEMYSIP